MPAQILDGKAIAADLRNDIRVRIDARRERGQRVPGLAVVLVGADPASQIYVRNKRRACEETGIQSFGFDLPGNTPEAELLSLMPIKEKPDTSKLLLGPMPGLIVSLAVEEGQEVAAGDTLCVVEAMKMENVLKAERDGTVSKILAKPGDSLNVDAIILEFA